MENLRNLAQNKTVSWDSIKNYLEKQNTDKDIINKIQSVFTNFDLTADNVLEKEELQELNKLLTNFDTDKDGKLSEGEINTGESIFKTLGVELTNKFIDAVNNAEQSEDAPVQTPQEHVEENNYEKDKNGNIITYPMEGETFRKTASRLGFKYGTDEYSEFVNANKKASNRKWFIVGEEVKIPPSLAEKVVKEEIISKNESKQEIEKYNKRVSAPKTPKAPETQKTPKNIEEKIAKLKDYTLTNDKNGYILRTGREGDIAFSELSYDLKGNLISQKTGYSDGKTIETNNGKTKVISEAAPELLKAQAQKMKQISGGDFYFEFDQSSKNYVCVQTGVKNNDVKEIRTELTTTKEAIPPSKFEKFLSYFGYDSPSEYKDKVITLSKLTTYSDGRVVKGEYINDRLVKNTVIGEHQHQAEAQTSKIYTNADITFKMPEGAPKAAHEFCDTLISSKEKLMRQLDIDNDTYNLLAQTAIGIAGHETKLDQYWVREDDGSFKLDTDSINFSNIGKDILNTLGLMGIAKWFDGDTSETSRGMTQLKFNLHIKEPEIKKNMAAFGITKESQLDDPKKSAIATMIVLSTLNKRLDLKEYQKGIETAQGINVEHEGWEINENGIAEKTGNTRAWKNEITRQDALCALWNGGSTAKSLLNGKFEPQSWVYTRDVKSYTSKYVLKETKESRRQAEMKYDETKPFTQEGNNGDMGSVVFLPGMYSDKAKHINTPAEIQKLNQALTKKGIDANLKNQLITAMQNGEIGFDFGLRQSEIDSLTTPDIKLLIQSLHELKNNLPINTSDGISSAESVQLRDYSDKISKAEDNFRKEYLTRHSKVYNASKDNVKVLRETSNYVNGSDYVGVNNQRRGFKHETFKGVNLNTTSGRIRKQNEALALAAAEVVKKNPENINSGNCLTGVKTAFKNAGIDVSDMSKYGSVPKFAKNWFDAHPEMFTPVEYIETGNDTARKINSSDINSLPAGYVVVFIPEGGKYESEAGHIVITNGYGQGLSDTTDNLGWGIYSNHKAESGKGEHGTFKVYKLSDNWDVSNGKLTLKSA